jgi:hypothetical protein
MMPEESSHGGHGVHGGFLAIDQSLDAGFKPCFTKIKKRELAGRQIPTDQDRAESAPGTRQPGSLYKVYHHPFKDSKIKRSICQSLREHRGLRASFSSSGIMRADSSPCQRVATS